MAGAQRARLLSGRMLAGACGAISEGDERILTKVKKNWCNRAEWWYGGKSIGSEVHMDRFTFLGLLLVLSFLFVGGVVSAAIRFVKLRKHH